LPHAGASGRSAIFYHPTRFANISAAFERWNRYWHLPHARVR